MRTVGMIRKVAKGSAKASAAPASEAKAPAKGDAPKLLSKMNKDELVALATAEECAITEGMSNAGMRKAIAAKREASKADGNVA